MYPLNRRGAELARENPTQRHSLSEIQIYTYEVLRLRLQALYGRDHRQVAEFHEVVVDVCDILTFKHADAREHLLFHLLSGSTLPHTTGLFDFQRPDSIEDLINTHFFNAFPARRLLGV